MNPAVKMLLDRSEKLTPMNDTAHTPTVEQLIESIKDRLTGDQCAEIGLYNLEDEIVRACNSYDSDQTKIAALVAALESAELSCTQAKLANGIGKKTKAQQISFLLASFELLAKEARAALSATKE